MNRGVFSRRICGFTERDIALPCDRAFQSSQLHGNQQRMPLPEKPQHIMIRFDIASKEKSFGAFDTKNQMCRSIVMAE
jgi:hypothetical protein